jgi:hypothetical protein
MGENTGTFDLAMWVCEINSLPNYSDSVAGVLHTLCAVETGARWTTLFVFVSAFSLSVIVWLDRRGEKRLVVTLKSRRASWRDDYYSAVEQ